MPLTRPTIFSSFIQSDFKSHVHANFEAVIQVGGDLWHYWRDNSIEGRGSPWRVANAVCRGNVAYPGALIQGDYQGGANRNFEVVVPLQTGARVELWHFFLDNRTTGNSWTRAVRVTGESDQVVGPATLIQSTLGSGAHGDFEVVVPIQGPHGYAELWHFWRDNTSPGFVWYKGQRITAEGDQVMGPGAIIQSSFGTSPDRTFEVLVPLKGPQGYAQLWHFSHDNSQRTMPWQKRARVTAETERVVGGATFLQGKMGVAPHYNFEGVVPIQTAFGNVELRHIWCDNSVATRPWGRGQLITASAGGTGCLIQSDYGTPDVPNFEVLLAEGQNSLAHYWRLNTDATKPWVRSRALMDTVNLPGEIPVGILSGTRKIVQLTGEVDREGWGGPSSGTTPPKAHNRTRSRFGISGTDLGVSFVHNNRTYFLFGDTYRHPYDVAEQDLDAIAYTTDTNAANGIDLTFLPTPPRVPGLEQRAFSVPIDGISYNGAMYVLFSTDAYTMDYANLMGRTILARSTNGGETFQNLYELSRSRFINVSWTTATGASVGLSQYTQVLLMWGSGRYRSSDVYLAAMPLASIATGNNKVFYAGHVNQTPQWVTAEAQAVPLFASGCVGELSVRWNPYVKRYLMLYNSQNPAGIVLWSARKSWGPWYGPVMLFEPFRDGGYGHFIHVPWNAPNSPHDFVHDNMFTPDGGTTFPWRENMWGGTYGPYQIEPLTTGVTDQYTQLYFTLSTWNPYQVMLMTTRLQANGPAFPP